MNEGISKEASAAAYDVYKMAHDREAIERAMQSLINSTLDRAAATACNAPCSLDSNDHIAEAILALKDTPMTEDNKVAVEPVDREAWEKIFISGGISGPESLARHRLAERERIVEWLREFGNHAFRGEDHCLRCQIAKEIENTEDKP